MVSQHLSREHSTSANRLWRRVQIVQRSLEPKRRHVAGQKGERKHPLSTGVPNTLAAQSLPRQPILGLEVLNDHELVAMDPRRDDHQQECGQWRHGTRARRRPRSSPELLDTTAHSFGIHNYCRCTGIAIMARRSARAIAAASSARDCDPGSSVVSSERQ